MLVLGLVSSGFFSGQAQGKQGQWRQLDLQEALQVGRKEKKAVLLFWTSPTCLPCLQAKARLLSRTSIQSALANFVPIELTPDVRQSQDWTERYALNSYPQWLLLNAEGVELGRLAGERSVEDFLAFLEQGRREGASSFASASRQTFKAAAIPALSSQEWRAFLNRGLAEVLSQPQDANELKILIQRLPEDLADRKLWLWLEWARAQKHLGQSESRAFIASIKPLVEREGLMPLVYEQLIYKLPATYSQVHASTQPELLSLIRSCFKNLRAKAPRLGLALGVTLVSLASEAELLHAAYEADVPAAKKDFTELKQVAAKLIPTYAKKTLAEPLSRRSAADFIHFIAVALDLQLVNLAEQLSNQGLQQFPDSRSLFFEKKADVALEAGKPELASVALQNAWSSAQGATSRMSYASRWLACLSSGSLAKSAEVYKALEAILKEHGQNRLSTTLYRYQLDKASQTAASWVAAQAEFKGFAALKQKLLHAVDQKDLNLVGDLEHFGTTNSLKLEKQQVVRASAELGPSGRILLSLKNAPGWHTYEFGKKQALGRPLAFSWIGCSKQGSAEPLFILKAPALLGFGEASFRSRGYGDFYTFELGLPASWQQAVKQEKKCFSQLVVSWTACKDQCVRGESTIVFQNAEGAALQPLNLHILK